MASLAAAFHQVIMQIYMLKITQLRPNHPPTKPGPGGQGGCLVDNAAFCTSAAGFPRAKAGAPPQCNR